MKPDHEINGRYFADAIVSFERLELIITLISSGFKMIAKQPLYIGKCFVEFEKFYGVGNNSVAYEIKLDQSGKAVVLIELPKEKPSIKERAKLVPQHIKDLVSNQIEKIKEQQQSDDELAEKVLTKFPCNRVLKAGKEFWGRYTLLKAMQEYHRVKSERLMNELDKSFGHLGVDFSKWLESKKK